MKNAFNPFHPLIYSPSTTVIPAPFYQGWGFDLISIHDTK
ncbi:hypothetical protein C3B79_2245 [Aeromonas hydrophila]|nr:hypothetical protein C3B79_2245 [Aeromonas hydrophila]